MQEMREASVEAEMRACFMPKRRGGAPTATTDALSGRQKQWARAVARGPLSARAALKEVAVIHAIDHTCSHPARSEWNLPIAVRQPPVRQATVLIFVMNDNLEPNRTDGNQTRR